MFFHYATRQISLICKISTFSEVFSFLKPKSHFKHFQNSNFKQKMKRLEIPQKLVCKKFYVHETVAVNLSKIYFLKNAKKTCKPNNRDLNRDWISYFVTKRSTNINSADVKIGAANIGALKVLCRLQNKATKINYWFAKQYK